jgi:iron complex transport system substrate-binding protein
MRIVSICPSNTEILHALGLMDQVVAVDNYSDWPIEETSTLPKLGPDLNIDMDKLETFQPDLVIASLSVPGMERNVERLEQRNIPHIVLNPKTIEDIYHDIQLVAECTGTEKKAEQVIESLKKRLNRIREKVNGRPDRPHLRLYWEWWPRPYISPAGGNWLTSVSELAGGINVFADRPGDSVIDKTGEDVINSRPDFILAVWCGVDINKINPDKIRSRSGWEQIPAVQSDRIFVLEEGMYCRPSPRLFDGLEELAGLLHPELKEQKL